jgi:hypothetical protein
LAGRESLIFRELIDFVESLGPVGEHFGDQGRLIGKNVLRIGRRAIDDHIGITIRVNPGADLNIDRLSLARPAFQALFQGLPQVQRDIIVRPGLTPPSSARRHRQARGDAPDGLPKRDNPHCSF